MENTVNASANTKQRFNSLDFLKFILAVVIVFHHFQQIMGVKFEHINFFYGSIYFGYAVEFFFIISGFVIAFQVERKGFGSFRSWMTSKITRILPMAVLSIIACFAVDLIKYLIGGVRLKGLWNLATSFTCAFIGVGVVLSELGFNNPLWYVCVLFICYAILYCLNRFSPKIGISVHYLYIGMVLLGLGIHYYKINLPFLNDYTSRGYVAFFLGMLLYELYKKHGSNKELYISSIILIAVCFVGGAALRMIDDQWAIFTFLLFPPVLFLFLGAEKFFSPKVFAMLGGVSFEMYLWHVPFLHLYNPARKVLGITQQITHLEMVCFTLVLIVFCLPVTLIFEKRVHAFCMCKEYQNERA